MNPNIYLGKNVGKCNLTHFSTFRGYNLNSVKSYEKAIKGFHKDIAEWSDLFYVVERGRDKFLHSHILSSFKDDDADCILKHFKPHKIIEGSRKKIIKCQNPETLTFKDEYVLIDYKELLMKDSKLYIEKIVERKNASMYTYKFVSYGLHHDYLFK